MYQCPILNQKSLVWWSNNLEEQRRACCLHNEFITLYFYKIDLDFFFVGISCLNHSILGFSRDRFFIKPPSGIFWCVQHLIACLVDLGKQRTNTKDNALKPHYLLIPLLAKNVYQGVLGVQIVMTMLPLYKVDISLLHCFQQRHVIFKHLYHWWDRQILFRVNIC